MVFWLWTRIEMAQPGSVFRFWLLSTITLVSISLIIDATDTVRYFRGERDPQLEDPARRSAP